MLMMTSCAEPTVISDDNIILKPTNEIINGEDNFPAAGKLSIDDSSDEETAPVSAIGTDMCHAHKMEYHFYPSELIDYIGDEFYDWVYMVESQPDRDLTDECPYSHCNIIECLNYFNISEEEFTELYYTSLYYYYMYDPEIMYSGNNTEIQNFFIDDKTEDLEFENRSKIRSAKHYLKSSLSDMSVDEQIVEKYSQLPLTAWTFSDIISEAQISRDAFEAFLAEHRKFSDAFDVDAIYHEVETMNDVTAIETNSAVSEKTLLEKCLENIEYEKRFFD